MADFLGELLGGLFVLGAIAWVVLSAVVSIRAGWHAGTAAKRLGRRFPPHGP